MIMRESKTKVFLSYAREDKAKVRSIYARLSGAGLAPWMDIEDLAPGEIWESSIKKAIRYADFFLAFLSRNSVNKRGFLQKEIKNALDTWQEKLNSDIYIIPVRLDDCDLPEDLHAFQRVDLFEKGSFTRLLKSLQERFPPATSVASTSPSFAVFVKNLPKHARGLTALPLMNFRNEGAFAILFQLEKIYSKYARLVVNVPPLMFWDDEDIADCIYELGLDLQDAAAFRGHFKRYQKHFRQLVIENKKTCQVVLFEPTFRVFLNRKSVKNRGRQIDDIIRFLRCRTFHLLMLQKDKVRPRYSDDKLEEYEIISKIARPDLLLEARQERTLSIQIRRTISGYDKRGETAIRIHPANDFLQEDISRIDEAWALALDQYQSHYGELSNVENIREYLDVRARQASGWRLDDPPLALLMRRGEDLKKRKPLYTELIGLSKKLDTRAQKRISRHRLTELKQAGGAK